MGRIGIEGEKSHIAVKHRKLKGEKYEKELSKLKREVKTGIRASETRKEASKTRGLPGLVKSLKADELDRDFKRSISKRGDERAQYRAKKAMSGLKKNKKK